MKASGIKGNLMIKKHILNILTMVVMLALGSCADEIEIPDSGLLPESPGTITINLRNCPSTRAEADASDPESDNETVIKEIYIGLYHALAEEDKPATFWKKIEDVTENGITSLVWNLTDPIVKTLFDGGNSNCTCRVVVLANVKNIPDYASISQIREFAVGSIFDTDSAPESFVMEGEAEMDYSVAFNKATATVSLIRAAAKVNLSIDLPEKVEIDGKDEIWIPDPDGIKVLLNNGVKDGVAAPVGIANNPWKPSSADAYYTSDPNETGSFRTMSLAVGEGSSTSGYLKYKASAPFYTYPNTWIENHDGSRKTSITLMVPWSLEGSDGEPIVYYYQASVAPSGVNFISRNHCYNIDLNVGMLGSVMPEKPLEVEGSYNVIDWQEEELGVPIQDTRYLVVGTNVLTLNNEEEISIPFYTSHPAEISDISISYKRFNFYNDGNGDVVNIKIPKDVIDRSVMVTQTATRAEVRDSLCAYWVGYSAATKQLTVNIKHPLKIWVPYQQNGTTEVKLTGQPSTNKLTTLANVEKSIYIYKKPDVPESSYSPYEINVTLSHKDLPSYKQEIKIIQYPGMYIEAVPNPGGYYNNDYNTSSYTPISKDLGYVFINAVYNWVDKNSDGTPLENPFGYWANDGKRGVNYSGLGTAQGLITRGNRNRNNYIITISQLEEGSEYIIGDSRNLHINNVLSETGNISDNSDIIGTATQMTWCYDANALYEGKDNEGNVEKRKLRYYYPTKEVARTSREAYTVSPKFRIASSYGAMGSTAVNKTNARRRAATYQEQGCPAGRWRLPTMGEIKFIMELSHRLIIPRLFTYDLPYWTAQGNFKIDGNGTFTYAGESNRVMRAVYDDWYWNDKTDYVLEPDASGAYSYTLGDVPRAPRETLRSRN